MVEQKPSQQFLQLVQVVSRSLSLVVEVVEVEVEVVGVEAGAEAEEEVEASNQFQICSYLSHGLALVLLSSFVHLPAQFVV